MHKTRLGIIRGGVDDYEASLKTGSTILQNAPSDIYHVRDILIDKKGNWFVHGIPTTPHEALTHIDVAFNALHGDFGEDGKIQHIFETHNIPFTGSGSFGSALSMNKSFAKKIYAKEKIKTPQSRLIEALADVSKEAHEIFKAFPLPVVVKPNSGSSSAHVYIAKDFKAFDEAVKKVLEFGDSALVEEYIQGREATCGVIDNYRDQELYALPVIEIPQEIVPSNFTFEEKKQIEALAMQAHKALGLRHYSRSDFIIHPKRGIFILETNSHPKLTENSLFPKALKAVGASISHFIDHVVQLALDRK